MPESKYFTMERVPTKKKRKTSVWLCTNHDGTLLGRVTWYAPWRRYVFDVVEEGLIFDTQCLRDIADFIDAQMARRQTGEEGEG